VISDWSFPVVTAMKAFPSLRRASNETIAEVKTGIAAKKRKKEKRQKFNQSMTEGGIRSATKIM
jgi:hypothetical protein